MRGRARATTGCGMMAVPPAALTVAWASWGTPLGTAGLGGAVGLGVLVDIVLPCLAVCFRALPLLLVPWRARAWWRYGRNRPAIPAALRRAVYAADRGRCAWCRSGWDLQVDHVRPWSLGGLSALWNLVTLCGACNRVKSNYWRFRDGRIVYRAFPGADDEATAERILAFERLHRWSPLRWVLAGLSLR